MQKNVKLDQVFMNNVEKTSNCIFKSRTLSLRYFEYVSTLFRSLSSRNMGNQQILFTKCTVLMLHVRQNERKKAVASRLRTKNNTHSKDVLLLSRY